MTRVWCSRAVLDSQVREDVEVVVASGRIAALGPDLPQARGDADVVLDGVVAPAFANTHSHLFHRGLRGAGGGEDFWSWRERMYALAARLDPDSYHRLARAAMGEMLDAGYTRLGEFHYVHHDVERRWGRHEMELALAHAACEAGMRLTLLDTCYLHAGLGPDGSGLPLAREQAGFGDGSVHGWLERWHELREVLPEGVELGAAVHSVRTLTPREIAEAVAGLPGDVPLHVHLSEQPRENAECLAATGLTPTGVLREAGALSPRTTAVHATHLSDDDVAALAGAGTSVSLCPSTEADLGDGIARVDDLLGAGVRMGIGSDENVVTDPFLELRMLEAGARLSLGRRGVVASEELWRIGTTHGRAMLTARAEHPARDGAGLAVGQDADLVCIDPSSARLAGVDPLRYPVVATGDDVTATVVAGRVVPHSDPATLREALAGLGVSDGSR